MTPVPAADLLRIADELRAINASPDARLTVMAFDGPYEADVVGTAAGFVRLAEVALRIAADAAAGPPADDPSSAAYGVPVVSSDRLAEVFDDLARVVPRQALVVATDADRRQVPQHFGLIRGPAEVFALDAEPEPPAEPAAAADRPTR